VIDWDTLVLGPLHSVFGEPVPVMYSIAGGAPFGVSGIFDEGARSVRLVTEPEFNEVAPVLGVRLSQFPAGYDPRNAQGDTFVVRGVTYVVKDGRPDSHGAAHLEATRQ
jgi:hypothetical protein